MTAESRSRRALLRGRLTPQASEGRPDGAEETPASSDLTGVVKQGRLLKLVPRGLLCPDAWKRRLCVLANGKLYIYKLGSSSGPGKPAGEIDLRVFSHCQQASAKERGKFANSFVIRRTDAAAVDLTFIRQSSHAPRAPSLPARRQTSRCLGGHHSRPGRDDGLPPPQGRHLFAAETLAEMNEWVKKIRSSVQSVMDGKRRKSASPSSDADQRSARRDSAPSELPPPQEPQLAGLTKRRARGPPRRRPSPRSALLEPARTASCPPTGDDDPARSLMASSCLNLVYEYSSSEESDASEKTPRRSVVRQLNTTMPDVALPPARRSSSPARPTITASSSSIYQQRAARATRHSAAPCLSRRKRASVPSLLAPRKELEKEFGGGSSTGSSSLSNLTTTLTREGQALPALLMGLERASSSLKQVSARVATLDSRLSGAERDLTDARADMAHIQDNVTSLQIMVTSTSNKMVAFAEMFQTVDEQLQDMWSEMETVNNNVHHVMHKALEHQRQNERLFVQLEAMRDQLLAAPPARAAAASAARWEPAQLKTGRARGRPPRDPARETAEGPAGGAQGPAVDAGARGKALDVSAADDPLSSTLVI